ncbi:MAG: tetratricopeptide repeat protein [Prevotella sp.]|nr:tetratricopeptide repeat protein [Prevotella sp.]
MIRLVNVFFVAFLVLAVNAQPNSQFSILNSQLARDYDILFHEAMLQRQKGNHDAAFDLLTRCIELRPEASEAYFFLGQYFTEMQQADRALEYFARAAALEPANTTYMETLAQAHIQKDQYAEATAVVERLYNQNKGRQDLLETLYRLYLQQEDYEQAIGVLERIEQIDGKSERTSLSKSGLYAKMNDHQRAVDEMRQLAEQYPNDLNYRTIYANTLLMNDEEDEARDILRQVLADEPDNVGAQRVLRVYFLRQGDTASADSITRAILLNPKAQSDDKVYQLRQVIAENEQQGGDSTEVLALFREMLAQPQPDADIAVLQAAYMDLKKMPRDSIAAALEHVLLLAPDNASARLHLVQYAWEDEDDKRIIELCRQARQYNPEEMAFYYYQGMAYYRQDDHDNALEAFQNGINVITDESHPDIVSDFYAVMGDLLHQKGREQEAFAAYDSCLQWKPDNVGCLNNYAYYLSLRAMRLDDAEQMSYKTIKAEPQNATYLDTYAWILFVQGRYAEARIYIDQALQNDSLPSHDVLEHAGDIYAQCGDIAQALTYWQQALADDPTDRLLIRKIKKKKYIK